MNQLISKKHLKKIGVEIHTNNFDPLCYTMALQTCEWNNYQSFIHEYARFRTEQLRTFLNAKKNTSSTWMHEHKRANSTMKLCSNQFALFLLIKLCIVIGLTSSTLVLISMKTTVSQSLSLLLSIFAVVTFITAAPDLLYLLSKRTWGLRFFQWNWYAALLTGAFSFANAVQYLKYSYYHG